MSNQRETTDFQRLFSSMPVPVLVVRPDLPRFTIVAATSQMLEATGRALEDLIDRSIFEAFPEGPNADNNGPDVLRGSLVRVVETGVADPIPMLRYDVQPTGRSFEERYWINLNSPLFDVDGRLEYILLKLVEATVFVAASVEGSTRTGLLAPTTSGEPADETGIAEPSLPRLEPLFPALFLTDGTLLRGSPQQDPANELDPQAYLARKMRDREWWREDEPRRLLIQRTLARVTAGGAVSLQMTYSGRDGEARTGDFSFSPIRNADGRVVLIQATGRDCTDELRMQEALSRSEQRYRSLVANLAGVVYRAQAAPPWRMLYLSEAVEQLTGYPPSWFIENQHAWASIMLPEDAERVAAQMAGQVIAGLPMTVEYRIRHRDGSLRWVEGRARWVENEPNLLEGTVFDIDERKRSEWALAAAERRQRALLANVPSLLFRIESLPPWRVNYMSDGVERLTGYPPSHFVADGVSFASIIVEEDAERIKREISEQMAARQSVTIEYRIRHRDGSLRWVEGRARLAEDNRRYFEGTVFDIDDRKRAEEALRESFEDRRNVIQSVPGVLFTAKADGAIDFVSDAESYARGINMQQLMDFGWLNYLHPDDLDVTRQRWQHSLATGEPYEATFRQHDSSGVYSWVQTRAHCRRDDAGRILRWYGVTTNIETIKQAQAQAEAASKAKGAFLSAMSHEIRTPLNAVLGFAHLLADTELGAQQREFVNSIRAGGDHLLGLINDILDFSKLESGSVRLNPALWNVQEIVESALGLVVSQAEARDLELMVRIDDEVPPSFVIDAARLRQILVNLLGNALKFTLAGEVLLSVSARPLGNNDYGFEFSVRDTGIGIAQEHLGLLFRDFSQIDVGSARRFGGTGLGLAITRRLVEAHDGTIEVQSQPGTGSCFTVRIPAQAGPVADPAVIAGASPAAESLRGLRVLLVDDNRSSLDILGRNLRRRGMAVSCTQKPLQVISMLKAAAANGMAFELVVIDHQMPGIDGITLAGQIRAMSDLPMVLLSTLGTKPDELRTHAPLFAAMLSKPVHPRQLFEALCSVMKPGPVVSDPPTVRSAPAVSLPAMKLLLVEDNLVNRQLARLLLQKLGFTAIDIAVDGFEALAAVQAKAYDVVLMDVQMPRLDGLDATRRIREEILPSRQPQIVAMTANAMAEDREACLAAGMDDYLAKPIELDLLTAALARAAARLGISSSSKVSPTAAGSPREAAEARAQQISDQVLAGGGEMGALMRRIDWSQTSLGPVYSWPQSLRTALSILLNQKHPMFLWWGPDLIQFYNDAYRPILGEAMHPAAMGQRGRDCWHSVWNVIGPLIEAATRRGEACMIERGLLCLFRSGFQEEAYFNYGYSPIRDEAGGVGGVLVACSEVTAEVLDARRKTLLLDLSEQLSSALDVADYWDRAQKLISGAGLDLPFALVYRLDLDHGRAQRVMLAGLPQDATLAPQELPTAAPIWPVFASLPEGRSILVCPTDDVPVLSPWPEAPNRALVLPISGDYVLVAGLSSRLPLNDAYEAFLRKLARQLSLNLLQRPWPEP